MEDQSFPSASEAKKLLQDFAQNQFGGEKKKDGIALLVFSSLGIAASASLGLFVVLVPATYGLGGYLLYKDQGWQFYQPGKGGTRFVSLNGLSWTLYATTILMNLLNFFMGDWLLTFASFAVGLLSYSLIVSSLLVFSGSAPPKQQVTVPKDVEDRTFNVELEQAAYLHNGERPTDLWWLFLSLNSLGCVVATLLAVAADWHAHYQILRLGASFSALSLMAAATAITHALGGQWRHYNAGYVSFQPGKGGRKFVALQGSGWSLFSVGMLLFILAMVGQLQGLIGRKPLVPGPILSIAAFCSLIGQVLIAVSLFFFEAVAADETQAVVAADELPPNPVMAFLKKTKFLGMNIAFSEGSTYETAREPKLSGPDDWQQGEAKFMELTKNCPKTGDQYLIIGVGFVGRRLVKRLLDRGETKIRLFDIVPHNPFPDDSRVEYVRGDVTKMDDVMKACAGVDTCYSTFAIIRFMDRLEHQAALSYRINVGGTENVLEACRQCNVSRVVVTSSSHATTDEHSEPRFDRTEEAPYVIRETAHNHYGWTKAAADIICLKANGSPKADGSPLQVAIIRPCSGVFGGDDRISFEKAMDLSIFPGLGAKSYMDWVYVENVVLGHLLLEGAMQRKDPDVDGEAFNISNNEACKNEDMWFSVMKIIDRFVHKEKRKSGLELIFIPEAPLWAISYLSELNQKIFKGKVSLGNDLNMMSPGMMATATMEYTYNSAKAQKYIGYEPAYTLDQSIQKSLYEYWEKKYPEKKNQ